MKISINIRKNDYVQPTEVREEVVQYICNYIVQSLDDKCEGEGITSLLLCPENGMYELYLNLTHSARYIYTLSPYKRKSNQQIRVRGVEMQAAFEALQDAGYYIFSVRNTTSMEKKFVFSTKRYYLNIRAERANFDIFID